jgi:hypothetical protein
MNDLVERQLMIGCFFDKTFDVPATHNRDNDIRLSIYFTHVVNRHDIGVVAEFTHCPRFADNALPGTFIEVFLS